MEVLILINIHVAGKFKYALLPGHEEDESSQNTWPTEIIKWPLLSLIISNRIPAGKDTVGFPCFLLFFRPSPKINLSIQYPSPGVI